MHTYEAVSAIHKASGCLLVWSSFRSCCWSRLSIYLGAKIAIQLPYRWAFQLLPASHRSKHDICTVCRQPYYTHMWTFTSVTLITSVFVQYNTRKRIAQTVQMSWWDLWLARSNCVHVCKHYFIDTSWRNILRRAQSVISPQLEKPWGIRYGFLMEVTHKKDDRHNSIKRHSILSDSSNSLDPFKILKTCLFWQTHGSSDW